jgi:O-antigen/teichoic acid export membrane protein
LADTPAGLAADPAGLAAEPLPAPAPSTGLLARVRRHAREAYIQLLVAQLVVAAAALVANVLIARALAPSGRGEIALMLQLAYFASQILLLGTEQSFIAGYAGSAPAAAVRAYARIVAGPCAVALGGVALVGTALAAVATPAVARPALIVLAAVAAFTLVNVVVRATRAVAIAAGRHTGFLVCTVLSQVLLLGALTALYLGGVTQPATWFGAYIVAGAVPAAACAAVWSRAGDRDSNPAQLRVLRREGLALFPSALANMGMLRIDRLVLPALASTSALGLYAAVATMTELLAWPLQAYADSRLGAWRAAHQDGRLTPTPAVLSAVIYVVVAAPVLGGAIYLLVVPLLGSSYASARALVLPLIAAAGLYAVSRVSLGMLIARRRNLMASVAELSGFVLSLIAYVVLIPSLGALGAAYGSLAGYGTCLLVALALLRRRQTNPRLGLGSGGTR